MNIWNILEIEKTTDKKIIKKAYHKKLRCTNPEEKQEEFIRLREAYEQAIQEAEMSEDDSLFDNWDITEEEDISDFDEMIVEDKEYEESEIPFAAIEKRRVLDSWWKRFGLLFADLKTRWDKQAWYVLLYEDIPYQMKYYKECRKILYDVLFHKSREVYLPEDVWGVIDGFFSYSKTDVERAADRDGKLKEINKKVKLNEMFDFGKFMLKDNLCNIDGFCTTKENLCDIDGFCTTFVSLIGLITEVLKNETETKKEEIEELFEKLKSYDVFYLPFVCLNLAYHFSDTSNEEIQRQIVHLEEQFGNTQEISLLKAEYALYNKDKKQAVELLQNLYKEVPLKNYVIIFQLAECCQIAELWYEAWMLYKMLTRLNPKPFMFHKAEEIYCMAKRYFEENGKLPLEDTENAKMHICKMYLEYDCRFETDSIWKKILPLQHNKWEYHIILCKYALFINDMKEAQKEFEILKNHEKQMLNELEKLEYRELQAEILFEEKKYKETIDACNLILEEYPLSYPVLLLRAYADLNCFGKSKRYLTLDDLIQVNPEGAKARILSSYMLYADNDSEKAIEVLKPVKVKCQPQLDFLRIATYWSDNSYGAYESRAKRVIAFFEKSIVQELSIPAKSKHIIFDLENVFAHIYDTIADAATKEEVEELLGLCERLKNSKYNHPEQYMDWCRIYKCAKKYDKAIEICNNRLEQETELEKIKDLLEQKFFLCYLAKYYSEAFDILPHLEPEEDIMGLMLCIGEVYEWAGKYEEAEKCLKKSKEYYKDHKSYNALEEYYFRREQWDKVEELAEEEIRLNGQSAYVYIHLFNLYIEMGKYDKALEYAHLMNKYAKIDYIKRQHHLCLGNVYMGKQDYAKALECFEQSEREHCPVKTWDSMADCNVALGKYREAIVFYEKEAYREEDVNIYYLCAMQHCYFLMDGQPNIKLSKQIQKETEKQMLLSPDKMRQYNCYLGEAMASRGMFEQAESYFKQAEYEKMCPECGRCQKITWGKAWLLLYQGKYKEAMDVFERAVEINKSEQTVYVEYLALKQIGKTL